MAQPPKTAGATASMKDVPPTAIRSHGRGGAGNINNNPPAAVHADDLKTPTIKSVTYTTGRGGSGNMAKNDPANPDETRLAQDVNTPDHHSKDMNGTYHWGRGGQGNMTTIGTSGADQARAKSQDRKKARALSGSSGKRPDNIRARTGSFKGAIDKGKELLGLKKNGSTRNVGVEEGAIGKSSLKEDESAVGKSHLKEDESATVKRHLTDDESAAVKSHLKEDDSAAVKSHLKEDESAISD